MKDGAVGMLFHPQVDRELPALRDVRRLLRERGVDSVEVTGLALDYCVKATALDARRAGFDVTVHRAATRAVDAQPGDGERAVEELRAAGVAVVED